MSLYVCVLFISTAVSLSVCELFISTAVSLYVCELFISTAVSLSVCELFQFPAVTCPVTLQKRYHGVLSGKLIDLMEVCIMSLSIRQTCVYDQMSWTRCTVKVVLTWTHCLLNHTFGHPD